ncbi:MAG: radical SAM protein [Mucilaginibacter sp.]
MKLSKFNTSIFYNGKYIYHNSFTQHFLLLDPLLMDLLNAAKAADDIPGIQEVHEDLYKSLLANGFIVPKVTDEIQKVRELINEVDNQDESYHLMVNPTMNCNFKCWYCYETHIKGSKTSPGTLQKITNYIENIMTSKPGLKQFILSFFGGEPLLYYHDVVLPLMQYTYHAAKHHNLALGTSFTTNGFLINEEMVADFLKYNVTGLQISFDGNKEQHDQTRFVSKSRGSYDIIVGNIKLLVRNNIKVTLRINYTEKNLIGLDEILESFSDLPFDQRQHITLSMNKVWQESNENLGDQVIGFKEKSVAFGFALPDAFEGDRVRNSCYADKRNQSVINYNGDVYKCNARDFTKENREGVLLEDDILWNDKMEERMSSKLKNKPCLECSILPICGGGCSQQAIEYRGKDYCVNNFDENKKKDIVLNMFLSNSLIHA